MVAGSIVVVLATERVLACLIVLWIVFYRAQCSLFHLFIWNLKYDIAATAADSRMTDALSDVIANQNLVELFASHTDESKRFRSVTGHQARSFLKESDETRDAV